MRRMNKGYGPFLLVVLLLSARPSTAQVSTFDLSGTVLDDSGAVLPGASVGLRNVKTGLTRNTVTDERGRYHFAALPVVGEYVLLVELQGFATIERTALVFQANTKPTIDFSLRLASVAESITVAAEAPILETRKSELGVTIDQQKIATMPLNGRNYLTLALFTPCVNPAAQRGDISVNGQLGRNIEYVVDGVSNDIPHALVANGTYVLPYEISVSGILIARSGATIDPQAGADLNGDAFLTDRPGTFARNSYRLESFQNFDMSCVKAFRLGRPRSVELRADVFNVFNTKNVIAANSVWGRNPAQPAATWLTPTRVADPRQLQFAARYRF